MRSASVCSSVAPFAPARQTGYVGSFDTRLPGPKITRPRTDGAEYLIEIVLPLTLTLAVEARLSCAEALRGASKARPAMTVQRRNDCLSMGGIVKAAHRTNS